MKLDIISHCYCPPGVSQYAQMLRWQYASLVDHPGPFESIDLTVCFSDQDEQTVGAIEDILKVRSDRVRLAQWNMIPERLFRRSIGRNDCALMTQADVVWFVDVDYFVGAGFLDAVAKTLNLKSTLNFPSHINVCNNHVTGDEMLSSGEIDSKLFYEAKIRRAIGGVQFIGGDIARQDGYNKGSKWMRPVSVEPGFRQCKCDVAWRRSMVRRYGPAERFLAKGLHRMRHSKDGRDFNASGVKGLGKVNW